jgi:hypothetical protein
MHAFLNKSTGAILHPQADPYPDHHIKAVTGVAKGHALGRVGSTPWYIVPVRIVEAEPASHQVVVEGVWTWDGTSDEVVRTDTVADVPLEEAKTSLWEHAKLVREQALSNAPYDGRWYQTDVVSRTNIIGAGILADNGTLPSMIIWTTTDNVDVEHSPASIQGLRRACAEHVAAVYEAGRLLREQINAAESVEALRAIDVTAGWPPIYAG